MQMARLAVADNKILTNLEKVTQALVLFERARGIDGTPDKAAEAASALKKIGVNALSELELKSELAKLFEKHEAFLSSSVFAVVNVVPADVVDASQTAFDALASLGLAADNCEHAAELLEKTSRLLTDLAARLAKEVPSTLAAKRGALQLKVPPKADPKKSSSSSMSTWTFWSNTPRGTPTEEHVALPPSDEEMRKKVNFLSNNL